MNLKLRAGQVILASFIAGGLSGCGGLRLHSEVRDKQGVDAKEAWSKVDTTAVIAAERGNLAKLLETELSTQDALALAIRDHTLRSIVDATTTVKVSLFDRTDKQLTKLVGDGALKKMDKALTLQGKKRVWAAGIEDRQETWGQFRLRVPAPKCADFIDDGTAEYKATLAALTTALSPSDKDSGRVRTNKVIGADTVSKLKDDCGKEPTEDPFDDMEGALGVANARHKSDLELSAASENAARPLKTEYKAAAKAYTEALGDKDHPPAAVTTTVAALTRLSKAAVALGKASDALSTQFISQEKLDSLNAFVDAVTQAGTDGKLPPDANKATVAFVLFPKLVDDAKRSLADAKAPLALPLLIQRNHQQLLLEAATREVTAREAMQRISQAVVDTTFEQARQLVLAKTEFESIAASAEIKDKATAAAFSGATGTNKVSLYRGAALYLDALNRLEARRYKLEYQYIAAKHELQLAYAEVNAKQWASLIGATVDQVAAGSAGGIKAESVAALLNTVGVFYIGHGVNK